jgi:predicted ATPase
MTAASEPAGGALTATDRGPYIFISYASEDEKQALEICEGLELRGLKSWISCQHIRPGRGYQTEIIDAIRNAAHCVLVFSARANRSVEIPKEISLASRCGLNTVPVRIEKVLPEGALEFELATRQWVDAFDDWEAALDRLAVSLGGTRRAEQPAASISHPEPGHHAEHAEHAEKHALPNRHNLPEEATRFIGREHELAEMIAVLRERRRVTLVGAGGVGKTRAAVRVGREMLGDFRDGVWLAELAPLADMGLVAEAVCRCVGIRDVGNRSAVDVAIAFLRQKKLMLILDNCEHLVTAAADVADRVLSQCPGVSILATSREPLNIPGEVVFKLPTLPVPSSASHLTAAEALESEAVRLFVERASDVSRGYKLSNADAPHVARICRRLDGVAMAIELAAARMKMRKAAEIARELENVFRVLGTINKLALPHQQTMFATIDWSHSLLLPAEQVLFRRLSVFVAGFSLEGAVAVAAGPDMDEMEVLDLLEALLNKSLINVEVCDNPEAATRYRMLEITREYARKKLVEADETGRDRLAAEYLAEFYARAQESWHTTPTLTWLVEYAPEVVNLRAAIDSAFGQSRKYHEVSVDAGDPLLGIRLVTYAGCIAEEMSLLADMKRWTQAALERLTPETPPREAGWVLFWATKWQSVFGAREVSQGRQDAIRLFREARDVMGLSSALRTTAMAIARPGDMPPEVQPMLEEAIKLLKSQGPTKDLADALTHMGSFHYFTGNLNEARRLYEEGMKLRDKLGDTRGRLASLMNLAELEFISGNRTRAAEYARMGIYEARAAGSMAILANLLANTAGYRLADDDVEGGLKAAREALALYRSLDLDDWAVLSLEHLALAHALSGELENAARLLGHTCEHFRRTEQVRDLLEQAGYERLLALLQGGLSPAALESLMAEGAGWRADTADKAGLAELGEPLAVIAA